MHVKLILHNVERERERETDRQTDRERERERERDRQRERQRERERERGRERETDRERGWREGERERVGGGRDLMKKSGPCSFQSAATFPQLSITTSFCRLDSPVLGSGVSMLCLGTYSVL